MELLKDIYFNTDKLVENTNVKVSYTGKFYQDNNNNNDKVFIHYGYGKNWDNIQDVEMKKTDLGYQAELNLSGNDTINFCFKNQNNEWDNNFGENYIFNIEKASINDLGITTFGTESVIDAPTANELNNIINPISNFIEEKAETKVEEEAPITALAVTNSKFNWRKFKTSIVKFFSAVPKFLSGNYKRQIKKNEN